MDYDEIKQAYELDKQLNSVKEILTKANGFGKPIRELYKAKLLQQQVELKGIDEIIEEINKNEELLKLYNSNINVPLYRIPVELIQPYLYKLHQLSGTEKSEQTQQQKDLWNNLFSNIDFSKAVSSNRNHESMRINPSHHRTYLTFENSRETHIYTFFPILDRTNPMDLIVQFRTDQSSKMISCNLGIIYEIEKTVSGLLKNKELYVDFSKDYPNTKQVIIDKMDESIKDLLKNPYENDEYMSANENGFADTFSLSTGHTFIIIPDLTYNLSLHVNGSQCRTNITTMIDENTLHMLHLNFVVFYLGDDLVTFRDLVDKTIHVPMLKELKDQIYLFIYTSVLNQSTDTESIIEWLSVKKLELLITHTYTPNSAGTLTFDVELKNLHMFDKNIDFYIGFNRMHIDELIHNITLDGFTEINLPTFAQKYLIPAEESQRPYKRWSPSQQRTRKVMSSKGKPPGMTSLEWKALQANKDGIRQNRGATHPKKYNGGSLEPDSLEGYEICGCYWEKMTLRVLWKVIESPSSSEISPILIYKVMEITPNQYTPFKEEYKYLFYEGTSQSPQYLFGIDYGTQYFYRETASQIEFQCTITNIYKDYSNKKSLKDFTIQHPEKPFQFNRFTTVSNYINHINSKFKDLGFDNFISKLTIYQFLFSQNGRWAQSSNTIWYQIVNKKWLLLKSERQHTPTKGYYIMWYLPEFIRNTSLWSKLIESSSSTNLPKFDSLNLERNDSEQQVKQTVSDLIKNPESSFKSNILQFNKEELTEINQSFNQLEQILQKPINQFNLKVHLLTEPSLLLPHFHIIEKKQNQDIALYAASAERHSRTILFDFIMSNSEFNFKNLHINQFMLLPTHEQYIKMDEFFNIS